MRSKTLAFRASALLPCDRAEPRRAVPYVYAYEAFGGFDADEPERYGLFPVCAACEMMPECAEGLPYCADEDAEAMAAAFAQGYVPDFSDARRHHEIHLSDSRKTEPAKMRTVVRHPIRKA